MASKEGTLIIKAIGCYDVLEGSGICWQIIEMSSLLLSTKRKTVSDSLTETAYSDPTQKLCPKAEGRAGPEAECWSSILRRSYGV